MAKPDSELEATKKVMGALVRMKLKPHEEMKIGKSPPRCASRSKAVLQAMVGHCEQAIVGWKCEDAEWRHEGGEGFGRTGREVWADFNARVPWHQSLAAAL